MKKIIITVLIGVLLVSCEDVIEVDLPTSEPRLVIDASINWFKGTTGNEQSIKLSLSAPFFQDGTPPANNATVTIIDMNSNTFEFIENGDSGVYENNAFLPEIDGIYQLTVIYEDEVYTAGQVLLVAQEGSELGEVIRNLFSESLSEKYCKQAVSFLLVT